MPERYNLYLRETDVVFYPLRPEFVESTYFLYRATRDPFYLDVGEMVLRDLNALQRTECGYASMQNVNTHVVEERMESFLLSETLKYLYLLFDDENPLHSLDNNYVFTTEGHVLLPLSPPSNRSAQYPAGSSFAKRRLIHSEDAPAAVEPFFYHIDNIRTKLASVHPDDMFSMPVMSADIAIGKAHSSHSGHYTGTGGHGSRSTPGELAGDPRRCPIPRSMFAEFGRRSAGHASNATQTPRQPNTLDLPGGTQIRFGIRSSRAPSPLQQLGTRHELARALVQAPRHLIKERQYLTSLVVNTATQTLPLRSDFYNVGVLANNGRHGATGGRADRSQVLKAALQLGLESSAMCVSPLLQLELAERHNAWQSALYGELGAAADAYCVREPPNGADTWLTPNTRQMPFMNFLVSRAEGRSTMAWDVPMRPKTRSGTPLLRDVWDEGFGQQQQQQDMAHDPQRNMKGSTRPKQRGYAAKAAQHEQTPGTRQLVITNGVGQVLTDYVIVRLSTDDALQEFVRALPVHNDSVDGRATTESKRYSATYNADAPNHEALATPGAHSSASDLLPRGSHVRQGDRHRRRDFAGRLASFAEPALYRGHPPYLVPQPTTVIMLHLYSSSSAYGCEQYTPREQRMVRGKVVAVRHGGGCSEWDKAMYAARAGAQALLVDVARMGPKTRDDLASPIRSRFIWDRRLCMMGKCMSEERPADSPLGAQADDLHHRHHAEELGEIPMPVVIVGRQVVNELEQYLISGLHVRAELL
ncbi:hypothetical protein EC988_003078 [Linderina pennispora]|nr:hypothetical protein EC988_003078 [Linderina pennispora]